MKRVVLLFLALTLVFSLFACAKSDPPIDPTSGTPATNPTADPGSNGPSKPETPTDPTVDAPTTAPTDPKPDEPIDPDFSLPVEPDYLDLQTANQLIRNYTWYLAVGLCCEFELIGEDMSAYLSDSQKQNYFYQQYRLLCCHTAEEVRDHINRSLSAELQVRGYPDDLLFADDQGTLYLIIIPTGYVAYRDVTVAQSGDCLYAKAGAYAEDGWFTDAYFTIETQNGNQVITQVYRADLGSIPDEIKDLTFCTPVAP